MNILTIALLIRKARLILAFVILTVVPATVVNDQKETRQLVPDKTRKVWSAYSNDVIYLLSALVFFSLIFVPTNKKIFYFSFF